MADIPVERRGGIPGWVWLLLALLIALLLFLFLGRGCGDDVDDAYVADTTTTVVTPPVMVDNDDDLIITGAADIEDLNLLFENARSGNVVGRSVRFNDVTVSNVVGDSTFYVRSGNDQAFVVLQGLGEGQTTGGCADGRYCIEEGDVIDIEGRVRALDDAMRAQWMIMPEAAQGYYINVRRIDN